MKQVFQTKDNRVTILGAETEFFGELTFKDSLIITGTFNGTINATGELEISKEAVCSVDSITANSAVIAGKVKGDISVNDFVELKTGSSIQGNIKAAKLRIEDGVDFQGKVSMVEQTEKTDIFAMTSSEYKDSLEIYKGIDNN
ncbi:MAG: bactofilin family protein [Treponemataceae bacterium]